MPCCYDASVGDRVEAGLGSRPVGHPAPLMFHIYDLTHQGHTVYAHIPPRKRWWKCLQPVCSYETRDNKIY